MGNMTKRKFKARIESYDDGDSFKITKKVWNSRRIRIAGKNSPERGERGYKNATENLRQRFKKGPVWIYPVAKDKYGRTVARVRKVRKDKR